MGHRFRLKLSLKVLLVVSCILIAVFILVTPRIINSVTSQTKKSLIEQSKSFGILATQPIGDAFLLYHDSGSVKLNERIRSYASLFPAVSNITIYDVKANEQYALSKTTNPISSTDAEIFKAKYIYAKNGYVERVIYPWLEGTGVHRFTFVYDISGAELEAIVARVSNDTMVASFLVLLVVNLTVLVLLQYLFIKPINKLSRLALAIGAGQYGTKIMLRRNDEIGDLATSIDTMSTTLQADIVKLSEAEKLKSEFLIISSHNLRTPLTVITGYIDLLSDMSLDETAKKYLTTIKGQADELTGLTNDMLTVAELEGGKKPKLNLQTVDLKQFLQDLQPNIQKRVDEKNQELAFTLPNDSVQVLTQVTYLQSSLFNLIDNAVKFTAEKGIIGVKLENDNRFAHLIVTDTGIGIGPEEVSKLFTKFHRGTSIMEYEYEGVGLGLYMTKLMIELVGGKIDVQTTLGKGSSFTISLPMH